MREVTEKKTHIIIISELCVQRSAFSVEATTSSYVYYDDLKRIQISILFFSMNRNLMNGRQIFTAHRVHCSVYIISSMDAIPQCSMLNVQCMMIVLVHIRIWHQSIQFFFFCRSFVSFVRNTASRGANISPKTCATATMNNNIINWNSNSNINIKCFNNNSSEAKLKFYFVEREIFWFWKFLKYFPIKSRNIWLQLRNVAVFSETIKFKIQCMNPNSQSTST